MATRFRFIEDNFAFDEAMAALPLEGLGAVEVFLHPESEAMATIKQPTTTCAFD